MSVRANFSIWRLSELQGPKGDKGSKGDAVSIKLKLKYTVKPLSKMTIKYI